MLELLNINKSFGPHTILQDINLQISRGEIFGFLGPNGSGKTTTIRIVLGLIRPDKGTVHINGYNIKTHFYQAISGVGAVVETPKFYTQLTGFQNISLIANLHPDVPQKRVHEVLELVGLAKHSQNKVATYSLGMKQRLGIARALINDPKLIFLDEPMNGLDPQGMFELRELIVDMAKNKNKTFFITSHLLHEIEQVSDKIAVIQAGKIIEQGRVADLLGKKTEEINIFTDSAEKAYQLIKNLDYVQNVKVVENGLWVQINKGYAGKLNKILVNNDIVIEYIIPRKHSLEDYYLELTSGGNEID